MIGVTIWKNGRFVTVSLEELNIVPPPPSPAKISPSTGSKSAKLICSACQGEGLIKSDFTGQVRNCALCLGKGFTTPE